MALMRSLENLSMNSSTTLGQCFHISRMIRVGDGRRGNQRFVLFSFSSVAKVIIQRRINRWAMNESILVALRHVPPNLATDSQISESWIGKVVKTNGMRLQLVFLN